MDMNQYSCYIFATSPRHVRHSANRIVEIGTVSHPLLRMLQVIGNSLIVDLSRLRSSSGTTTILTYNTRLPEAVSALLLKIRIPSAKLILQIEDFPSARYYNSGFTGFTDLLSTRILSLYAELVLCVSSNVKAAFLECTQSANLPVRLFPPMLDSDYILTVNSRKRPFSSSSINVLYAGSYGIDNDVLTLVQAFASLQGSELTLNLVGEVPKHIQEICSAISSIRIVGYVELARLFDYYAFCDVVILTHSRVNNPSYIYPFKLIEILASGALPLISRNINLGDLLVPEACLFNAANDLTSLLLSSRKVWAENSCILDDLAATCRMRFNSLSYKTFLDD